MRRKVLTKNLLADNVDYTLAKDANGVWVSVDGFSVYIRRNADGVSVEITRQGEELDSPIDSIRVFD